jgi:hypothetical protein
METLKNHKKTIVLLLIILLIIAGLLDIKYEGLFFQLLPHSAQSFLGDIF